MDEEKKKSIEWSRSEPAPERCNFMSQKYSAAPMTLYFTLNRYHRACSTICVPLADTYSA